MSLRIPTHLEQQFRCPICSDSIRHIGENYQCQRLECGAFFPIVNGIPILINEKNSLFSKKAAINSLREFDNHIKNKQFSLGDIVRKWIDPNRNFKARENYSKLVHLLLKQEGVKDVLVLGGGILGAGMNILTQKPSIHLLETDVTAGERVQLICDAHDIPFEDRTFDAVIIQAVLEHVIDPPICVAEIHRVLKERGIVYAETPFIQQVHMGATDFTRFTVLGHRRLFRDFEEITSGPACGPSMALAWSFEYFIASFFTTKRSARLAIAIARLATFWLKFFDSFLINKPGAYDAASSVFFLGRKSNTAIKDKELINQYIGIHAL